LARNDSRKLARHAAEVLRQHFERFNPGQRLFSFALLVALGAADREHDAFALEGEVAELERGELAAAFVDSREAS